MNNALLAELFPILIWIVVASLALLTLYGVIRAAISRGLRDHVNWMERHQAGNGIQPQPGAFRPVSPPPALPNGAGQRRAHLQLVRHG